MKRWAILSIGTNSTRAVLADMAPDVPHVELARSIGTRIGEGLRERGHLGDEPMERTLEAIRQHLRLLRGHYVRLFTIATSALRRADNAGDFTRRVIELTGVPVQIITGEEEAAASYRGAITMLAAKTGEELGVADVGGGSTEYAVGGSQTPDQTVSCEIGAVRLTEALPALAGGDGVVTAETIEQARALAREALKPLTEFPPIARLALVGGSATTAAAIVRAKKSRPDRYEVSRIDLDRTLKRLCAMRLDERKDVIGMVPQRADILPAGIIVLETILDVARQTHAVATTADLLLGYLLQQRDREGDERSAGSSGRTSPHQGRR
jgi:exopolyphosphatase / guanosine-5'-triphosphate,3'-diphosphate pyrophosphatase